MFEKLRQGICNHSQNNFLEMKTTMSGKKNALDGINIRLHIVEERVSEHKGIAIDVIQIKTQKEKRTFKNE